MKRKIVKQGNSALTITLPSFWTKELNLHAGDEIEVIQEKDYLKLTADSEGEKTIEIDTTELNEALIWTYIIAAYRKGYDEIKIIFSNPQLKTIQKVVDALLGLAIIKQDSNSLIIKDLSSNPTDKEFDNIVRRIFYLLEDQSESCLNALKQKNKEDLKNIELKDYNVNKFSNFCLRLISKRNLTSTLEYIVSELENLGDEYAKLSIELSEEKLLFRKELITIFEEVNKLFLKFHKFYYDPNKEILLDLIESKNKINKKINSINPKSSSESIILFHLSKVVHIITNIGERAIMIKLS